MTVIYSHFQKRFRMATLILTWKPTRREHGFYPKGQSNEGLQIEPRYALIGD